MKLLLSALLLGSASMLSAAAPQSTQPAPPAQPAPPSIERQELGRRYISLAVSPEQFMAGIRASAARTLVTAKIVAGDTDEDADADKTMDRFFTLLEPKLRERLPNLMEAYAQVYAREFSADELKQMIDFVQTPAGRHYLARRVDLENDPAVQLQEQGIATDMPPILRQMEKEQCAARTAQRIAAGDTKARCPLADKPDMAAG